MKATKKKSISTFWKSFSRAFDPVQALFNGNYWEMFVRTFGSMSNEEVLDLGCGTGEILQYIQPAQYTGVDSNRSYIAFAKERFLIAKRTFKVADVVSFKPTKAHDTVLLSNIAHHLSDDQLSTVLKNIETCTSDRIIIVDGYPKQPFTGVLWWLDDILAGGRYFRTQEELIRLLSPYANILARGEFRANRSFYTYPYVVLTM